MAARGKLLAWGKLFRLPNLFTAWGDPAAGFILAGGAMGDWPALAAAAGVSVLLYAMGLAQNDLAGLSQDRKERPERPLPSRALSIRSAILAVAVLSFAAVMLAGIASVQTTYLALSLVGAITFYNYAACNVRVLRPVTMGACRGLSVLVGASAVLPMAQWPALVFIAAGMVVLYIAAVTQIASYETRTCRIGPIRWMPAAMLAIGYFVLVMEDSDVGYVRLGAGGGLAAGLIALAAVAWAAMGGARLAGECSPPQTGKTIGLWIRGLLLVQASLVIWRLPFGAILAAAILVGWPINRLLSRKFPPS
jgi:4-hydroxybenzoate polyprenyltransferase